MLKHKIRLVTMSVFCFLSSMMYAQIGTKKNRHGMDNLNYTFWLGMASNPGEITSGNCFLKKHRSPYLNELMYDTKKPTSALNMKKLSGLVNRYLVYQKKFVRFRMIPPKIRITIRERQNKERLSASLINQ